MECVYVCVCHELATGKECLPSFHFFYVSTVAVEQVEFLQ